MKILYTDQNAIAEETVTVICRIQTVIALVAAPLILLASETITQRVTKDWALAVASILTLLSIPSVAKYYKWKLTRFQRTGWKTKRPELDLSGSWSSRTLYGHAYELNEAPARLPKEHLGKVRIEQTINRVAISCIEQKDADDHNPLMGWKAIAIEMADDGSGGTFAYQMSSNVIGNFNEERSLGMGIERFDVIHRDSLGRPVVIQATWRDCAHTRLFNGKPTCVYIGSDIYVREGFSEDGQPLLSDKSK
jgi:hypothetical protein